MLESKRTEQYGVSSYMGNLDLDKREHTFMTEEVLTPFTNLTDGSRLHMFTSNLLQSVILDKPELPAVYTGFEKQIGENSPSSYSTAPINLKLEATIAKNALNNMHILLDEENKVVHCYYMASSKNITEHFGYQIRDHIKDYKLGDTIQQGSKLKSCSSYLDEEDNFGYGVNLNVAFCSYLGKTFEDAIVISKSAAERLKYTSVENIEISLNTNDALVNFYGNDIAYKGFPDIGEAIKDKILVARRRLTSNSLLYDFSHDRMSAVNPATDTIFYSRGKVVDIDIFSNTPLDQLKKQDYNEQVAKYVFQNGHFYATIYSKLKELEEQGYSLSNDASFWKRKSYEYIDPATKYVTDNMTKFDNYIIRFRIEYETPLTEGSKMTGRYGNKGIVSWILDDDEMPVSANGDRIDCVLNPLGVPNRLNFSQSMEQELNFIASELRKRMLTMDKQAAWDLYVDFMQRCSPRTYANLPKELDEELLEDIFKDRIYIQINPFFDNINFWDLTELYKHYDIKPYPMVYRGLFKIIEQYNPDFKTNDNDLKDTDGIVEFQTERPIVVGSLYFMRLKHESYGKLSARSAGYLSLNSIPSRNNRQYKNKQALYSKTAIRFGEMELGNLAVIEDMDEIQRFIATYSSDETARHEIAEKLLGVTPSGYIENSPFNIEKIVSKNTNNKPRQSLDAFLATIGIKLEE